jgi:hypothetical protein
LGGLEKGRKVAPRAGRRTAVERKETTNIGFRIFSGLGKGRRDEWKERRVTGEPGKTDPTPHKSGG